MSHSDGKGQDDTNTSAEETESDHQMEGKAISTSMYICYVRFIKLH